MTGEAEPSPGETVPIETEKSLAAPPPLPERLVYLPPVIYAGTGVWLLASVVLLIARYAFDATPPIWLWTALAGAALGLLGLPIMAWQRHASRRGNRGAQRGL